MGYENLIQRVLCYIDDNLTEPINPEVLANIAGFSTHHFHRVFGWYAGCSVMKYVRSRRLAFAAAELTSGRKLIDIAMDYGFETHSGFSKAFKRRYGVSPETYRTYAHQGKPPTPDILSMKKYYTGGIVMEPTFVTRGGINLVGYELKTRETEGENSRDIPAFWDAYMTDGRAKYLRQAEFVKGCAEYGACFPVSLENGEFSYVIGLEIKDGAEIPQELHVCHLPPATYAVFSVPWCEDFTQKIQGTWRYIMEEWFPASGYEYAPNCVDFEYYDDAGCGIHIPVVKK